MVSVPLFDRNQGNVRRASHDAVRARVEREGLELRVVAEVRRASIDYWTTREAVRRIEATALPRARDRRDRLRSSLTRGEGTAADALGAQQDYNDLARLYFESLVDHRRSMLRLNTAVGRRVLP